MFDVLKSAALYTVYAAVVAGALNLVATLVDVGGTAAGDVIRIASTALSIG